MAWHASTKCSQLLPTHFSLFLMTHFHRRYSKPPSFIYLFFIIIYLSPKFCISCLIVLFALRSRQKISQEGHMDVDNGDLSVLNPRPKPRCHPLLFPSSSATNSHLPHREEFSPCVIKPSQADRIWFYFYLWIQKKKKKYKMWGLTVEVPWANWKEQQYSVCIWQILFFFLRVCGVCLRVCVDVCVCVCFRLHPSESLEWDRENGYGGISFIAPICLCLFTAGRNLKGAGMTSVLWQGLCSFPALLAWNH